jgi:hypothetical protein
MRFPGASILLSMMERPSKCVYGLLVTGMRINRAAFSKLFIGENRPGLRPVNYFFKNDRETLFSGL